MCNEGEKRYGGLYRHLNGGVKRMVSQSPIFLGNSSIRNITGSNYSNSSQVIGPVSGQQVSILYVNSFWATK